MRYRRVQLSRFSLNGYTDLRISLTYSKASTTVHRALNGTTVKLYLLRVNSSEPLPELEYAKVLLQISCAVIFGQLRRYVAIQ